MGVNVSGAKVDTMTAFELPVAVTSSQKLTNFVATVVCDDEVLEYMGDNPVRFDGAVPEGFKLRFYARDQHLATKTSVRLASMSAVDEHGLVANPIADVTGTVLIHDAHPLVPAKVSLALADVKTKTEQEFDMTLAVTTTESLTNLVATLSFNEDVLEIRKVTGAELRAAGASAPTIVASGAVPGEIVLTFYAKENHEVKSSSVTVTPVSGTDHNGLPAEFSGNGVGTVVFEDSHPWQPATVSVGVAGKKVDTLTEFELPVTITSSQKLTNFVATVTWDEDVLEFKGASGVEVRAAGTSAPTVVGDGSNFVLKFYAKNQHTVEQTAVLLKNMSAVDEHGLVANPIADAMGTILIHDSQPLVPAEVAIRAGNASVETRKSLTVPLAITSTKALTNLSVTVAWDADVLEWRGVAGGGAAGVRALPVVGANASLTNLVVTGTVPQEILITFYAKDQHTVKKTTIALSDGAAVCGEGLTAHVTVADGTVDITDSNPPVAANAAIGTWSVRVTSGSAFELPIRRTSDAEMTDYSATLSWNSDLTYIAAEKATVTKHSATSATFTFATSGTKSTDYVRFVAPAISGLQSNSWVKITAARGTSGNGLAAKMTKTYPITSTVLVVREIGRYSPGDIDGDGKLTDADVEKLKNYIKYQSIVKSNPKLASKYASWNLTGQSLKAADVNTDGKVDKTDLSLLVGWVAEYKELYK